MGRGRQKAKHTKVARELKYFSPDTDYSALARELGGPHRSGESEEEPTRWSDHSDDDSTANRTQQH